MNAKIFQVWTIWQALFHMGPRCHVSQTSFSQSEGDICPSWAQNVVRGRWQSFWRLLLKSNSLSRLHRTRRPWPLGLERGSWLCCFDLDLHPTVFLSSALRPALGFSAWAMTCVTVMRAGWGCPALTTVSPLHFHGNRYFSISRCFGFEEGDVSLTLYVTYTVSGVWSSFL